MRRWIVAMLVVLVPAAAGAYAPAAELCVLDDARIRESSGIVASSLVDGVFFTHNDSGDGPRLFAIDEACRILATIAVTGARAQDWEDIARGPGSDGSSALYIGDIGNNNRTRTTLTVYEVREPLIDTTATEQELTVPVTRSISYQYDDGPQDAETLLVDPSGRVFVMSKALVGLTGLSALYAVEPIAAGVGLARRVALVSFLSLGASNRLATAGDIAPDGSSVVVRTYSEAYEWHIGSTGLADAMASTPQRIELPRTGQGEAIGYTRDGAALVTTTEGAGPVHILRA